MSPTKFQIKKKKMTELSEGTNIIFKESTLKLK